MHTTGADLTVQPVISVGSRRGGNGPACIFVHSRADQTAITANVGSNSGYNILQRGDPSLGNDSKQTGSHGNESARNNKGTAGSGTQTEPRTLPFNLHLLQFTVH